MAAPDNNRASHHPRRWLALLMLIFAMQIGPLWYATPDSACYLSIARSIAHDHVPANRGSSHLYYSIGYPILISPAFLFDDRPFLFLSLMHFFWAIVLILGVYCWSRRNLPDAAFWITSLTVVNVSIWDLFRRPLSEMPFMAILVLIANFSDKIWKSETSGRRIGWIACVASLTALLALIRPAGILVAAGFGLTAARSAIAGRIGWTRAIVTTLAIGVPASAALLAMIARDRIEAGRSGGIYVQQIAESDTTLADQIIEGVRTRIIEIGRLLMPGMYKCYNDRGNWLNANMAIYVPLCVLICIGWVRLLAATNDVLVLTLPPYMLVYIIWPYEQATRFVAPMLPVWVGSLWLVFCRLEPNYRGILYSLTLGAHFAVAMGYWLFDELRPAQEMNRQWNEAAALAETIQANWRPVVVSERADDFWYVLQYQLDRLVQPKGPNDPMPADAGWLVLVKDEDVPEGFVLRIESGRYRLFAKCLKTERHLW